MSDVAPTPPPCVPPPPPGGCYECPPGSGQIICVDGPYEYVPPAPPVPTLSEWGLLFLVFIVAIIGAWKARS